MKVTVQKKRKEKKNASGTHRQLRVGGCLKGERGGMIMFETMVTLFFIFIFFFEKKGKGDAADGTLSSLKSVEDF